MFSVRMLTPEVLETSRLLKMGRQGSEGASRIRRKPRINRHDFGVSWNDVVEKGGVVVGKTIDITIDAEAILGGSDDGAREAKLISTTQGAQPPGSILHPWSAFRAA
jgi:hypothetical protein